MDPQPPSYDEAMLEKPQEKPTAPPAPALVPSPVVAVQLPPQSDSDNLCPVCRRGQLQESFSCLGICLAIALFPCGILCCLKLKDRICDNQECGATY